jgi:hypothetical protein
MFTSKDTVLDAERGTSASHCKHALSLIRGPPAHLCQEEHFTVIVAAELFGLQKSSLHMEYALNISLSGTDIAQTLHGLGGFLTSSLQCRPDNDNKCLVTFEHIFIRRPGQYRLRFLLAVSSLSGMTVKARVDSDIIEVGKFHLSLTALSPNPSGRLATKENANT